MTTTHSTPMPRHPAPNVLRTTTARTRQRKSASCQTRWNGNSVYWLRLINADRTWRYHHVIMTDRRDSGRRRASGAEKIVVPRRRRPCSISGLSSCPTFGPSRRRRRRRRRQTRAPSRGAVRRSCAANIFASSSPSCSRRSARAVWWSGTWSSAEWYSVISRPSQDASSTSTCSEWRRNTSAGCGTWRRRWTFFIHTTGRLLRSTFSTATPHRYRSFQLVFSSDCPCRYPGPMRWFLNNDVVLSVFLLSSPLPAHF